MTPERLLIFGGNGQIGSALRDAQTQGLFPENWHAAFVTRTDCDITNPAMLRSCIQDFAPSLIINAAGMTNVKACEKNPDDATAVNFHAVAHMAAQASSVDIPLIHLSTDYVFDGTSEQPYRETDPMNPINDYAASKVMGEEALRYELPWHVILRLSSVFSLHKDNTLTKAISLAITKSELTFVTDIINAPTPANAVADAIIKIATALLGGKVDGFGTFHFTGTPACSRYTFMQEVLSLLSPHLPTAPTLTPTTQSAFPNATRRPAFTALNCQKIKRVYDINQPLWQDALPSAIKNSLA